MNKISFSLLIIILLISVTCPAFANQTIIPDNLAGKEIEEINYPEKMLNNNGTVKKVNDSGHIENNNGIVINLSGSIYNNYGTVDIIADRGSVSINEGIINKNNYYINVNNASGIIKENNYRVQINQYGTVETNNAEIWTNFGTVNSNTSTGVIDDNFGTVDSNSGIIQRNSYDTSNTLVNSVTNSNEGKVIENNAKVSGGIIEKNYSKDVDNTTIDNNYSNEVGEKVTIKRNFANFINNANIENQYYKLAVDGNVNLVCTMDTNNNLEDNIYIDQAGQIWIRAEDAMYTITAKENYRIVDTPTIIAGGTTVVTKEDARNISFSEINGEITIKVETEKWVNYPINEGNSFEINKAIDESLTITVSNADDSVVKIQYKKIDDDEYKQATGGFSSNGLDNVEERFVFRKEFLKKLENATYQFEFISERGISIALVEINDIGTVVDGGMGSTPETIPEPSTGPVQEVNTTNNPQTGNSIIVWLVTLLIATIGLIVTRKSKKI